MKGRKNFLTVVIILFILMLQVTNVFAADTTTEEAITKIKIGVTNSNANLSFVSQESTKYEITAPTQKISCEVGETGVEVLITVKAKTGYYFKGISKGDISFKNDSTGVKCTDVDESDYEVKIEVEVKSVNGKLDEPSSAWWDDDNFGYARWDEVDSDGVTGYKISINGYEVTTSSTSTCKDLLQYLSWGKENTFKVKAISSKSGIKDSSYTKSDELDLTSDSEYYREYYGLNNYKNYGYGPSNYNSNIYGNSYGWVVYNGVWFFIDTNRSIKKGWLDWNGQRYYLDSNGVMVTGWYKISGNWYYFATDGHMYRNAKIKSANGLFDYYLDSDGKMIKNIWQNNSVGWYYINSEGVVKDAEITIDSKIYRFNSEGYMITGWYWDGSYWYYYYPDGTKAFNTIVWSNNTQYKIDSKGRWTY